MIPELKRAKIIEALKANPNASAVAREHGVSKFAVSNIAKQSNIDLAGKKTLSEKQRAQIIEALKTNSNASAVAREMGNISPTTVGIIAKELKVPLQRGGRRALRPQEPQAASAASHDSR
jgi:transposase-like protein